MSGLTLGRSKTDVLPRHFDIFLLHQTQTTQKMKSIKIIIAIILTIQTGVLFAGNENLASVSEMNSTVILMTLAPSTPAEAIFEEVVVENTFLGLLPATPEVASFEDFSIEMVSEMELSPVTPSEADFTDTVSVDLGQLAPVTPIEADFE